MVTNEQPPRGVPARVSDEQLAAIRARDVGTPITQGGADRRVLLRYVDYLRSLGSCADTAPAEKGVIIHNGDHAQYEIDNANTPKEERADWPLPSFDARDWADAFCKDHPEADHELMLAWFANALVRGFDEGRSRSPPPVEARAVGMTEAAQKLADYPLEEFGKQSKPDNYPLFGANSWNLTVGDVRAARAALSTRLASGGEEDARLKDARKTIEEAYAFASPSYEAAANVDALECVSAKLEAWLNANPLAALPADKGE